MSDRGEWPRGLERDESMRLRALLGALVLAPILLWLALSILGTVDVPATARLFAAAGGAAQRVVDQL